MISLEMVYALIGNHLWQSALLALGLAALLALGGRLSASTRHALAMAAFLGAALLPLAALLPGDGLRVSAPSAHSLRAASSDEAAARMDAPRYVEPNARGELGLLPPASRPLPQGENPDARAVETAPRETSAPSARVGEASAGEAPRAVASPLRAAAGRLQGVAPLFFGLWVFGAALLLARVTLQTLAAERLRRAAAPFEPPTPLPAALRALRLATSERVKGPMVVGLRRPTVVLPPDAAARYAPEELRALLEHERAHVVRGDLVLCLVQRLLIALFWWSPAMHWIGRKVADECEMACDEAAAAELGDPRRFASALTNQARRQLLGAASPLAVGAAHGGSQLARRVRRLVGRVSAPSPAAARLGAAGLGVLIAAAAVATPRLAAQEDSAAAAAEEGAASRSIAADRTPGELSPLDEALLAAADDGAIEVASVLLEAGADANTANEDGVTPLMMALDNGDDELVRLLISSGAAVNARENTGATPLMVALDQGDSNIVYGLLEAGAEVDVATDEGLTPLMIALDSAGDDIVQALIEAGADVRAATRWGQTPLMIALEGGDPDIVLALIEAGADVNASNRWGHTPLMIALDAGDDDTVLRLIDAGADVNAVAQDGTTPLAIAADRGDADLLGALLAAGARADAVSSDRRESEDQNEREDWREASRDDERAAARDAFSGGSQTCAADSPIFGGVRASRGGPIEQALYESARRGRTGDVAALIEAGADLDASPDGDGTALMGAASRGHRDVTRALLEAGADPDVVVPGDGTALIEAARAGRLDIVRILLNTGADPDLGVMHDGNPLIAAARRGEIEIVEALLAAGADPNAAAPRDGNPLIGAALGGHVDVAERLLAAGADPNGFVFCDETPLINAAQQGHIDVAEVLVAAGADVSLTVRTPINDYQPEGYRSPLSEAERNGHGAMIRWLEERGAEHRPPED